MSNSPHISVIIPVWNPGEYIDTCIDSLLAQTLPAAEFEVIFVDDGSTDGTPARLATLAEEHAHIRVIRIPNSGWPGKPRNVGVEAARGEYVFYQDQDDRLGPEALERFSAATHEHRPDVVLGKVVGVGRWSPTQLFDHDDLDATLLDSEIVTSLTPHKLFRRAFLLENGIAFPEGKRRLEDFLYVMKCYVLSRRTMVLTDYAYYFYTRRDDGKNTSFQQIDPTGYFENLSEVVGVVKDAFAPGVDRDQVLARFYRSEVVRRLTEPNVLRADPVFLDALVEQSRRAADRLFDDSTRAVLAPLVRVRAQLLAEGRTEDLLGLARSCSLLKAASSAKTPRWDGDELVVAVAARIEHDGRAWSLRRKDDGSFTLDDLVGATVLPDPGVVLGRDQDDLVSGVHVEFLLRDRECAVEWLVPAGVTVRVVEDENAPYVVVDGLLRINPLTLAGGAALERGMWDLSVRLQQWGVSRVARVAVDDADRMTFEGRRVGTGRLAVMPYATKYTNLSIDVGERSKKVPQSSTVVASGSGGGTTKAGPRQLLRSHARLLRVARAVRGAVRRG